jgi:uncharacterized protein (TIGR04222 family)
VENPPQAQAGALDAYSTALLAGRDVATHAALAQLIQIEALKIDFASRELRASQPLRPGSHDLETILHRRVSARRGVTPQTAVSTALPVLQEMEEALLLHGLLLPDGAARRVGWWAAAPCGALLLLGGAKILIGMDQDKPVSFLFVSCLIVFIAAWLLVKKRPRRTEAGDEYLAQLREEHQVLRSSPLRGVPEFGGAALPLDVGLFGYGVLAHTQASGLRTIIPPPASAGDGGCGSGCSGGGGGCGSGCGACGGCD